MKIYTRTGDGGDTSLWGKAGEKRVRKDAVRVEAYGTVDEANAALGVARREVGPGPLAEPLQWIQHRLFAMGADLSNINPDALPRIQAADVDRLEQWIDEWEATLPPLRHFILPSGSRASVFLHVARTVTRRAERRVVSLVAEEPRYALQLRFLNRLSDLLFVAARTANHNEGSGDEPARF
ncbi:MAG: cob(I)yrinic acid a,c-diamide adenosyltransferase [Thermaerobacter sp.]|nr:cob(I)yrinic acid a,c-diamide adenosyltransferase [Thermaerobacter sp.]